MSIPLYGIAILLLCAMGYYASWRMQARGRFGMALLLLMVCGFALRLYTSCDFYLHPWDERYHALVAKNLMAHPLRPTLYENPVLPYDYTDWTFNHIWLHKQPLPLWSMSLSLWLFGVNEMALRLPSMLLSTLGIGLTFSVARYFFRQKVAYLAAGLYSINGLILELAAGKVATDHIDIFFLFFVQLAIYFGILFIERQKTVYNVLAGIGIGAAVLCKWLPALVVLPVWLLLVSDSKKFTPKQVFAQFVLLTGTAVAVFLPWQLYIFSAFPAEARWESAYNFRHMTQVLGDQTGPFYYFLVKIRINYGDLVYLPLAWFTRQTIKNKDLKRAALLVWFYVPFVFFSLVKTKMQAYILFTAPVLFMATAAFWHMLYAYRAGRKHRWFYDLVLVLLLALPVRYSLECIERFSRTDRAPQWVSDLKRLNREGNMEGILFNHDHPVDVMFYTRLTAYPGIPDRTVLEGLLSRGHNVIINDKGDIPPHIRTLPGIRIERLMPAAMDTK